MSVHPTACAFLLVAATSSLLAAMGQQVLGPASVTRGRQVDLRPLLSLPSVGANCTVRVVTREGISCGLVQPAAFECAYRGNVTYQHMGCLSDTAWTDFQVQTQSATNFLTIEIRVYPYDDASNVFLVATKPTQGRAIPFRVVFPVNTTRSRCYYTVARHVWFPLAGEVTDSSQQLIPCGFAPAQSLAYAPSSNKSGDPQHDYVPLRIVGFASTQPEIVYALAALQYGNAAPPSTLASYLPAQLSARQFAATVLRPDTSVLQKAGGPPRKLVYRIAANYLQQRCGSFGSFPPTTDQLGGKFPNITAFTEADLVAGNVAFWPLSDNSTQQYSYTLLDFAGSLRGSGSIVVTSEQRNWNQPSLRRNDGLVVMSGGSVAIGRPGVDLYYTASELNGIVVRLVQPPKHGCFHLMNTTCPASPEEWPLKTFLNGCLLYTHFGLNNGFMDTSVWVIACPSCKPFELFVPIKVIQVKVASTPTSLRPTTHLALYSGYAVPIDVPDLTLAGPGLVVADTNVTMFTLNGTLVRIPQSFLLQLNSTSILFPYVSVPTLPSSVFMSVTTFPSLTDILNIRYWYVPQPGSRNDQIVLSVGPWVYPLSVTVIADKSIGAAFYPSAAESVPSVVVNKPLPISTDLMTFITPNFLRATGGGGQGDGIVFEVSTAPNYGKLCILSTDPACRQSVSQFTQRHIDSGNLSYIPQSADSRMPNDTFRFRVRFSNTTSGQGGQPLHTFHVTPVSTTDQPPLQFWVMSGKRKVVTYSYFKQYCPSSHPLVFRVTSRPKHGYLNLSKRFTKQQLLDRNVTYTHNSSENCSDSFKFQVTSPACNASGTMTIAIRTVDPNSDNNAYLESTDLTVKGVTQFHLYPADFHFDCSFCFDFVDFRITKTPLKGLLLLERTQLGTLVALGVNSSTFSYNQVSRSLLRYALLPSVVSSNPGSVRDAFDYTIMDPTARSLSNPQELRSVPIAILPLFNIIIDLSCTSNCMVSLNSPKLLTNLSGGEFGTVFCSEDIVVAGVAANQFKNISVQLVMPPSIGKLSRTIFSLQDLNDKTVVYSGPLQKFGNTPLTMTDSFSFSIIETSTSNPLFLATGVTFYLQWCVLYFDPGQNLEVKESDGKIVLSVRRNGPGSGSCRSPSTVVVSFTPINATASNNCSNPTGADFCGQPLLLSFSEMSNKMEVQAIVYDNHVPQLPRQLVATLTTPSGSTIDMTRSRAVITISDPEDFAYVWFTTSALTVPEESGYVRLNLSRIGDLEQEVRVICYTEDWTAARNVNFVERPNSLVSAVVFPPNGTHCTCNVALLDGVQDQPKVAFHVKLATLSPNANLLQSDVVVYIVQDISRLPAVSFDRDNLVVATSEDYFTIVRNGSTMFPTTVYLSVLLKPQDTALEGVDFELTSKVNTMGGATLSLSVTILNNSTVPGNKVFHVQIASVDNGHVVEPSVLTITVLDMNTPAMVEFESAVFHLDEKIDQFATIPLVRTGNPLVDPHVLCLLKAGNLSDDLSRHIFVPPVPQTVQFGNASRSACDVLIFSDSIWTGPWTFLVVIQAVGRHSVIGSLAQATVIVDDPENKPRIEFKPSDYYEVVEPMSNWEVDRTTLVINLTVEGDLRFTTHMTYYTVDGTGAQGVNYAPVSGSCSLGPNTSPFVLISIDILADYASDSDHSFFLLAVFNSTLSTATQYGNITVTVVVRNREPDGVYFPALPTVTALSNVTNQTTSRALVCLTPCDEEYEREDYIRECSRQDIASSYTVFSWEASYDGAAHFVHLSLDTVLTSARAQVLEEVYLRGVTHVRCSIEAVSSAHTMGTWRTSLPFDLAQSLKPACAADKALLSASASLTSYPAFSNSSRDLVRLSIALPHDPFSVPIVSSRPLGNVASILTYPTEWHKHSCANLADVKDSFLSSPVVGGSDPPLPGLDPTLSRDSKSKLLYSHLECSRWHFEVWLPLGSVLGDCQPTLGADSLQLYVAYVQLYNNTPKTLRRTSLKVFFPRKTADPQPVLYSVLPSGDGVDARPSLEPLASFFNHTRSRVEMYLYAYLPVGRDFDAGRAGLAGGGVSVAMDLLYTTSTGSLRTQVWRAAVTIPNGEHHVDLQVSLAESNTLPAASSATTVTSTFSLGFNVVSAQWSVPAVVQLTASHSTDAVSSRHNFTYDEFIHVIVTLPQWVIPTRNASLYIQDVALCVHMCNCTSHVPVLIINGTVSQNLTLTLLNTSSATSGLFGFHGESLRALIQPEDSMSEWCVLVSYSLVGSGASLSGTATSTFTLTSREAAPTVAASSPISTSMDVLNGLTALVVLLLAALVCAVIAVMRYRFARSQGRPLASPAPPVPPTPSSNDSPPKKADPEKLRRRHSVIGCPVRERYVRRKINEKAAAPLPPSRPVPRSGSLPDLRALALRGESFFPRPRQRLLKRPYPKVKVLNTERHLLVSSAVDNGVHFERRRLRNCIVNDLGAVAAASCGGSRRSDIALHAEKCIAASASTPEPGAYPLTRL